MKRFSYLFMAFVALFVFNADAAMKVKNHNLDNRPAVVNEDGEELEDAEAIATLENDIRLLDEEIAKCKKQKKGWIAATVVGAAGVVATGTAAAVQGVKIGEKKDTYESKQKELKSLKEEKKSAEEDLKKFTDSQSK